MSLFKKVFGLSANAFGRKVQGNFQTFGKKCIDFTGRVDRGLQRFDQFANKAQNVLEKVAREDPTPFSHMASAGLGVLRQGSQVLHDGVGISNSLIHGNFNQAAAQGRQAAGHVAALGGTVGGLMMV